MSSADDSSSLMCTHKGCMRRWVCNFGKRLCSEHDRMRFAEPGQAAQQQIPETLRPASRPYTEVEVEDEPLPF